MLRVEGLSHSFKNGPETTQVLHSINFEVKRGEMVALLGSSGSGKSTLLNLMAGLMKPTEGSIYIADQDIVKLNENSLAEFRRKHIGFIFQAYELIANLTVRENVELPLIFQGIRPSERKQKSLRLLEQVGIPDKAELFPSQLSGGQQQRVSIARSLITEPSVIFADEPTGNLDTRTEEEIIAILKNLNETVDTTFIIVTHEMEVAEQTKRIITLKDGVLIEDGSRTRVSSITAEEAVPEEKSFSPLEVSSRESTRLPPSFMGSVEETEGRNRIMCSGNINWLCRYYYCDECRRICTDVCRETVEHVLENGRDYGNTKYRGQPRWKSRKKQRTAGKRCG
ncbi:ABC transporter-like protein [Paenibacillus alvei A6-6i-x]|nr:ABC transporter-like protein [Paenibacillus alvei A6-6i-x]